MMGQARLLHVMAARGIRLATRAFDQPRVADIVEGAFGPVRRDCIARAREHRTWGRYGVIATAVNLVTIWTFDALNKIEPGTLRSVVDVGMGVLLAFSLFQLVAADTLDNVAKRLIVPGQTSNERTDGPADGMA